MLPKVFREKLGLDKIGKATIQINKIVVTPPKNLPEVRTLLRRPSFRDTLLEKEQNIGAQLVKKHSVR